MAIIRAQNLGKVYSNGTVGLDGLAVEVGPGEMVGVLGSSGAGKTTFFRLLNGTLRPTTGQLDVLGHRLAGSQSPGQLRQLRARIGLVNQNHNVIPSLSVLQNVLIGRLGRVGTLRAMIGFYRLAEAEHQRAVEALALVGLADKIYARAEDLSGGQQQRVAIARTIMQGPEIVLADEPIASVDMRNAALILDLFRRLNQELGVSVVMNLHQLDFAIRYCPRILVLRAGRLVYDGDPAGLKNFDIYGDGQTLTELPPPLPLDRPGEGILEEAELGEFLSDQELGKHD